MTRVSVIIVNYNSAEMTFQCIRSVQQYCAVHEIIVVDNASLERDILQISNLFPEVRFLSSAENTGFGKAVNKAVTDATGDYLFLLNPDCTLMGDVLTPLQKFYEQKGTTLSVGCCGLQLYGSSGAAAHSYDQFPRIGTLLSGKVRSLLRRLGTGAAQKEIPSTLRQAYRRVGYVTGAALFISRKHFDLARGFDPQFFMYFEETDLQYRLSRQGLYSYVVAAPPVVHIQGGSQSSSSALQVMYRDSMFRYIRKHKPFLFFLLFRYLWLLLDLKTSWLKYRTMHNTPSKVSD